MNETDLSATIDELRGALNLIENGVADGALPSESLEGFKVTVDEVRTRILAMMGGVPSGEYTEHVAQLQANRADQLCTNVHADLALGTIDGQSGELRSFIDAAASLRQKLQAVLG